jgi:hypothetical protein
MLNRIGLTVLGLVLGLAGGAALARALGALGRDAARTPLLGVGVQAFVRGHQWFWPAAAATGIVLGVLGLAWLVALLRVDRVPELRLESGVSGVTRMAGGPAGRAVAAQVGEYPGVRRAHATLRGRSEAPRLDLRVSTTRPEDLSGLMARLHDEAVPDLRATLGLNRLPALVRLGFTPGRHTRQIR